MNLPPLDKVLLIDDSEADNFLHQRILRRLQFARRIEVRYSAEEALAYLSSHVEGAYPRPDLILLDINMPGMNGWDFVDAYAQLPPEQQGNALMIMLSTSLNPEDRIWVSENPLISGFLAKPLTTANLQEILERYFQIDT